MRGHGRRRGSGRQQRPTTQSGQQHGEAADWESDGLGAAGNGCLQGRREIKGEDTDRMYKRGWRDVRRRRMDSRTLVVVVVVVEVLSSGGRRGRRCCSRRELSVETRLGTRRLRRQLGQLRATIRRGPEWSLVLRLSLTAMPASKWS